MASLDGKVALVTGAGSGIGRAIALAMAAEGATIAAADIDLVAAQRVADDCSERGPAATRGGRSRSRQITAMSPASTGW